MSVVQISLQLVQKANTCMVTWKTPLDHKPPLADSCGVLHLGSRETHRVGISGSWEMTDITGATSTAYFTFASHTHTREPKLIRPRWLWHLTCRRDLTDRPRLSNQKAQTRHTTLSTASSTRQFRIISFRCTLSPKGQAHCSWTGKNNNNKTKQNKKKKRKNVPNTSAWTGSCPFWQHVKCSDGDSGLVQRTIDDLKV